MKNKNRTLTVLIIAALFIAVIFAVIISNQRDSASNYIVEIDNPVIESGITVESATATAGELTE